MGDKYKDGQKRVGSKAQKISQTQKHTKGVADKKSQRKEPII